MRLKSTLVFVLAGSMAIGCSGHNYEKTAKGVIITLKQQNPTDVRKVRLEVMGEKLIHVSATPESGFSINSSLIVVPQSAPTTFSVEEKGDTVVLKTTKLQAKVSTVTGEVVFADSAGRLILSEDKGGRSFQPIAVDNTKGYSVRQIFQSPNDEAFYGLGQHQADEFNYKGKNEELFQYNTKVSVPFIVSNKNYGILWDSYSLCRFGDQRGYSQLQHVFKLYDKEGKAGGLTGTYIPGDKSNRVIVRNEDSLYFEDLNTIKNLPAGFRLGGSKVTYEGEIEPSETGNFKLILYYAGYTKVYIDNQLIVPERWRTAWNPNSYKFSLNLKAGKRVPLKVEWLPDGDASYCGLRVLSPVPQEEQNKQAWWSEMNDELNYYFVYGNDMDDVIRGYRTLTGKSQIMPKWAMGFWQSRERYKTQDELLATLKEFRKRHIPIDNIILDWRYWTDDSWGTHEFDKSRFPNPKAMLDSIHAMNAKMMISVWPKFYYTTEHYKEFDRKGWMYRQAVKDSIRDWVGKGYIGSFYDAYSADARKLFWKQINEKLYSLGIDAWWMDASEPDIQSCSDINYRKKLCGPTALGSSTQYFNAYALMNADAIYNGQRGVDNNKRVFLLTRSGYAGLQRYSTATWSGDIGTRWEDMKSQISAGLNFAVSGIPYWTMDIGGFCVEKRYEKGQFEFDRTGRENADYKEWRELNTRWYQFGAFCPLFRSHGQFPYREVWNIAPEGHPAYNTILYYTKLRYNLMPYIYSLAGMTYFNDYTIMRPLVMDFTTDTRVNNIGDEYMFGPALLVAPVYEYGARQRQVYFPAGSGWYDFYTGNYLSGGQKLMVAAPYEHIPLFIREGAIIPYGPDMEYSNQKQPSEITLYVYAGKDGKFTLYEDEGVNYNYEKGKYAQISFSYDNKKRQLTIGNRNGDFQGMLKERTFNIVFATKDKPQPFDLKAKGILVKYDGKQQTVKL